MSTWLMRFSLKMFNFNNINLSLMQHKIFIIINWTLIYSHTASRKRESHSSVIFCHFSCSYFYLSPTPHKSRLDAVMDGSVEREIYEWCLAHEMRRDKKFFISQWSNNEGGFHVRNFFPSDLRNKFKEKILSL